MTDADTVRSAALIVASAFLFGFGMFTHAFAQEFTGHSYGVILIVAALVAYWSSARHQEPEPPAKASTAADGGWEPKQEGEA